MENSRGCKRRLVEFNNVGQLTDEIWDLDQMAPLSAIVATKSVTEQRKIS